MHERIHEDDGDRRATRALDARGRPSFRRGSRRSPTRRATLHVRGRCVDADALAVAIVGSRRATPYGLEVAETLAADLAARGVTIVSGLARGIDSAAHRGALRVGRPHPRGARLRRGRHLPAGEPAARGEIAERGALISQFAPGTPPLPQNFPTRNRGDRGGCRSRWSSSRRPRRSGSLITARLAARAGPRSARGARAHHLAGESGRQPADPGRGARGDGLGGRRRGPARALEGVRPCGTGTCRSRCSGRRPRRI